MTAIDRNTLCGLCRKQSPMSIFQILTPRLLIIPLLDERFPVFALYPLNLWNVKFSHRQSRFSLILTSATVQYKSPIPLQYQNIYFIFCPREHTSRIMSSKSIHEENEETLPDSDFSTAPSFVEPDEKIEGDRLARLPAIADTESPETTNSPTITTRTIHGYKVIHMISIYMDLKGFIFTG
jgi:hypothetical protein